jgi:hypothetical protein
MRMLACYEKILKEKKRPLSRRISVLDFFKSSSVSPASPPVLLDTGDDPDDPSTVKKKKCLLLQLQFVSTVNIFCKFYVSIIWIYLFFLVKTICLEHFNIASMGKSLSYCVVSTNDAGLGTTYDVTSENDCDLIWFTQLCLYVYTDTNNNLTRHLFIEIHNHLHVSAMLSHP